MALRRIVGFNNKAQTLFKESHAKWTKFSDKIVNFETPERLKGTFLEKWGKFWRNCFMDYKEAVTDAAKDCKERPVRASIYASILGGAYYFAKHNPDEASFRETLLNNTMRVVPVGEPIRNPVTVQHIQFLEQCYNLNVVRRLDLGIFSLIWIDNYDSVCAHYRATCKYLKPRYVTFYERVVDIGFLDTWWVFENKMKDYDINENEFKNLDTSS